jgi:hypothetical protein
MNPIRSIRLMLAIAAIAVFSACATLGAPPPETFNQKMAVAVAGITEARHTVMALLMAQKISAVEAAETEERIDEARALLNVARILSATDPASAASRLDAASRSLQAMNTYLIAKQGATK